MGETLKPMAVTETPDQRARRYRREGWVLIGIACAAALASWLVCR